MKTLDDFPRSEADRLNLDFQRFALETHREIARFRRDFPGEDFEPLVEQKTKERAEWWTARGIVDPYRSIR